MNKLESEQTVKSLTLIVNQLIEEVNKLASQKRDRGPKSENAMTEEHARKILMGDLKDTSHKKCAELLGLSYGQVYSARNGYTFKEVYKEFRALK
jgi:DNA-directed RNA polymerase specialized sigma24 family protein